MFIGTQICLGTKTLSVIFPLQLCLAAKHGRWFLDSGCSRHMTRDKEKFSNLEVKDGGKVIFGGKEKGKIIGQGKVSEDSSYSVDDVLLVEGLNYNLLSISQLCDKGLRVIFEFNKCKVVDIQKNEVKLEGQRINDVYVIDLKFFKK